MSSHKKFDLCAAIKAGGFLVAGFSPVAMAADETKHLKVLMDFIPDNYCAIRSYEHSSMGMVLLTNDAWKGFVDRYAAGEGLSSQFSDNFLAQNVFYRNETYASGRSVYIDNFIAQKTQEGVYDGSIGLPFKVREGVSGSAMWTLVLPDTEGQCRTYENAVQPSTYNYRSEVPFFLVTHNATGEVTYHTSFIFDVMDYACEKYRDEISYFGYADQCPQPDPEVDTSDYALPLPPPVI